MRKIVVAFGLMTFIVVILTVYVYSENTDIVGTWVGETVIPNAPEPDKVTLVITYEEGKLSGTASDSMGLFQNIDCGNMEFKDRVLTFNLNFAQGLEMNYIIVTLAVEGDKMTGKWEDEEGNSSEINLERQE